MCDWVICRPPKHWNFQVEAKVDQTTAIVTTSSISCLVCESTKMVKPDMLCM